MSEARCYTKMPQRMRKELVEDYPMLSLSELGRGLLHEDKNKRGTATLTDWSDYPRALFETKHFNDGSVALDIIFQREASRIPSTHQEVRLEGINATFGQRPYAICPSCGSLRLKLLFTRRGQLSCRSCLNLTYASSRENHAKPIFRQFRKHMKIRVKQIGVKRVDYAGRMTRKARSVMRMAKRVRMESHKILASLITK